MKKHTSIFFLAIVLIVLGISCKKINEATELGGDLIPAVDNVNTFEVALNTTTDNLLFTDTTKVSYTDYLAAGNLNDPEFGQTHANFHFDIIPASLGISPFLSKDSTPVTNVIDSVVLTLDYQGGYGDTINGMQTLRVYEIAQSSGFSNDAIYKYADPATDFATTGGELGSKTFSVINLKDSIQIERPQDTTRTANVVRIKLNNSLGERFSHYDTTANPATGGYHSDSTFGGIFRSLFRGLAIKADNSGNVLTYYSLTSGSKTKLTVYYKMVHTNGTIDTLSTNYYHAPNGAEANYVKITPAGNWAGYLANGSHSDDKIYLQAAPSGSYASIVVPGLDTFGNKIIHRAELIIPKLVSTSESLFPPPGRLFLDKTNSGTPDSAFVLNKDLAIGLDGSINFATFGGNLKSDQYVFNISRHVQGIVTRHEPNDTLRLYFPRRANVYALNVNPNNSILLPISDRVANGRVVLAGGAYADASKRLRLRIVYSNL